MTKLKPYSASILALAGTLLVAMGIYFIFLRPPLLPEDLRYMKTSLSAITNTVPGLPGWLQKVFRIMGSYIFTTGLFTVFISFTSFRNRLPGIFVIIALTGMSSIGSMIVVNFMIGSDFKWILLICSLPWVFSLILYGLHK